MNYNTNGHDFRDAELKRLQMTAELISPMWDASKVPPQSPQIINMINLFNDEFPIVQPMSEYWKNQI